MRGKKKAKKIHKKPVFLLFLLALLAGSLWWSNSVLQIARFTVSDSALPGGFDGLRVVQLSDLHESSFGPGNQRLFEAVAAEQPEYIFLTGDLLDRFRGENPEYVAEISTGLTEIAPTYFVTGNHEWALGDVPQLKEQLKSLGVEVLSNRWVELERNGDKLLLAGIDDPNGYADQKTPQELAAEIEKAYGGKAYWLLLAHRNDRFADEYAALGADLTISGHGHGGVIRLPFTDGLLSTDRTFFPSYTAGFYTVGESRLFVSRGVGNSGPMLRLFNRPEIAVLDFSRETPEKD